jgi:AcrR family transcriptional regulator
VPGEADRQRRSFAEFRLPPGRHGIPADEVAANQRWRLLGAAAEVLAEQGHVNTTSTQVSKHAGVSPATFYQHFDNISDCLVAAYGAASGCVLEIVSEACREERIGWPQRLGVAVASTLRFLAVEPATAHLLGTEPPAGERAIARERQATIEHLAGLLAGGRGLRPDDAAELPAGTERHLVAGAVGIYSGWVAAGDVDRLPELAPELTEMLAAPYGSRK